MMYPDTRSARYGLDAPGSTYSGARKRDAGKESRIILFSTLPQFFTRFFLLSVAGVGVALVPCSRVLRQHETVVD